MEIILYNARHQFFSVRPMRIFLQSFVIFQLLLCFAYQSKLLDCLIKQVTVTAFSSTNEIAELLKSGKYKLITSADNETSTWFMTIRTSPLEGIRNLYKALEQHPPMIVETFEEALIHLLPYSLRTISSSINSLSILCFFVLLGLEIKLYVI